MAFAIYFATLPFVHAYTLFNAKLTSTIFISIILLLSIILKFFFTKDNKLGKNIYYIFLIYLAFCIFVLISSLAANTTNTSTFSHTLTYFVSPLLFFIVPLAWFQLNPSESNFLIINKMSFYTAIFLSSFLLMESFLINIFGIQIQSYIFKPISTSAELPRFLSVFIRPVGFSSEPGHTSLLLEILMFSGYYYLKLVQASKLKKILFIFLIYIGIISTASVAGILFIPMALLLAIIIKNIFYLEFTRLFIQIFYMFAAFILFLLVYLYADIFFLNDLIDRQILNKFESYSANDRLDRVIVFYESFMLFGFFNLIFGAGPGIVSQLNLSEDETLISLPLLVLGEIGILGLLFLIFFIFSTFYLLSKLPKRYNTTLLACLLVTLMHYLLIANYWYPYLWLAPLIIFVNYYFLNKSNKFPL